MKRVFKCPPGLENCSDVEVLQQGSVIRIPWTPEGGERIEIVEGGEVTLWLTIFAPVMPPVDIQIFNSKGESLAEGRGADA